MNLPIYTYKLPLTIFKICPEESLCNSASQNIYI